MLGSTYLPLGMISTEQNQIIKLFSVMAVMLMPPVKVLVVLIKTLPAPDDVRLKPLPPSPIAPPTVINEIVLTVANRSNYAQDLQISSRGFGARANQAYGEFPAWQELLDDADLDDYQRFAEELQIDLAADFAFDIDWRGFARQIEGPMTASLSVPAAGAGTPPSWSEIGRSLVPLSGGLGWGSLGTVLA